MADFIMGIVLGFGLGAMVFGWMYTADKRALRLIISRMERLEQEARRG